MCEYHKVKTEDRGRYRREEEEDFTALKHRHNFTVNIMYISDVKHNFITD